MKVECPVAGGRQEQMGRAGGPPAVAMLGVSGQPLPFHLRAVFGVRAGSDVLGQGLGNQEKLVTWPATELHQMHLFSVSWARPLGKFALQC